MEDPASALGWLQACLQARFPEDASGRLLLRDAHPGGPRPQPRLVVGAVREGLLWRLRADLPRPLVAEIARLLGAERPAPEGGWAEREPERLAVVRARLGEHAPSGVERSALLYRVEGGGVRWVGSDDRDGRRAMRRAGLHPWARVHCLD